MKGCTTWITTSKNCLSGYIRTRCEIPLIPSQLCSSCVRVLLNVLRALLNVAFESRKADVTAAKEKYDVHLQTLNKHD